MIAGWQFLIWIVHTLWFGVFGPYIVLTKLRFMLSISTSSVNALHNWSILL